MNREFKFRAWVHPYCGGEIPQECYNSMDYSDNYQGDLSDFFKLYSPVYFAIMQFTGLKDKNGKEIYEGDIVKTATEKAMKVSWNKKFASFCLNRKGWAFSHFFGEAANPEDLEVIGNVYSNPELIVEQKL